MLKKIRKTLQILNHRVFIPNQLDFFNIATYYFSEDFLLTIILSTNLRCVTIVNQ